MTTTYIGTYLDLFDALAAIKTELQEDTEWLQSDEHAACRGGYLAHMHSLEQPFTDDWCDPRITRRDAIMAAFKDEPLSKETANELINELAAIEASLQTCTD